jgi:hypothetical protein
MGPYNYCKNNPINFIDFHGDSVTIKGEDEVYYKDGNLYWRKDNTEYNGSAMRTGLMAFFFGKYSGFIGQAYYALRTIESGSNGSKLISSLVNSSENSWIKETEGGSKYNSGSNTTLWNPNEDYRTMDNFDRISSISMTYGLAHELGHNYNDVIGGGMDSRIYSLIPGSDPMQYDEFGACRWENLIRAEQGVPIRAWYYIDYNGVKIGNVAP